MKIVLQKSKNKQFFFTLEASNGKVIMTSETYKRRPWDMINKLAVKLDAKIISLVSDKTK